MKKKMKISSLFMIFAMIMPFLSITVVKAEPVNVKAGEDGFGLDGKSFAIITKGTMLVNDANNKLIEESYLSLTDSYNDEYRADSDAEYNSKRIGGKKILKEDLDCTNALVSCKVKDDAITFWHFEIDEEMQKKIADSGENNDYDSAGNKSSRYAGVFKWYNIYTIDELGNKRYLNLNFGGETGYAVEISDKAEPVAVLKRNNGEGYMLWGHDTHHYFLDDVINIMIPAMRVNGGYSAYNYGLFTGTATYNSGDISRIFVLAEKGFEDKELTSLPNVVKNSTNFNAKIKLFDYNNDINFQGAGKNGFKFYNGNNNDTPLQIAKDGYGATYSKAFMNAVFDFKVENKLGDDGYPVTSLGSLNYLFNDEEVEGKTIASTNIDAGSLFQVDEDGYFYYDSVKNAAYFDGNKFVLYDSVIRPEYTLINGMSTSGLVNYANDERKGNFLPFNTVDQNTLSPYDITKTTTGLTSYKLTSQNDGVANLWFGMTMENKFYMPKDGLVNGKDMTFSFSGDDFVLVYVDDALVLHYDEVNASEKAYINFKTGEIADSYHNAGEKTLAQLLKDAGCEKNSDGKSNISGNTLNPDVQHTIKFFYVERGGNLSYFNLNTNLYQNVIVENPSTGIEFNLGIIVLGLVALGILVVTRKVTKFKKI